MDGALSTVLQSSTVERQSGLVTSFGYIEGPVSQSHGFSYGVDIRHSRLLRWQAGKGVKVVQEHLFHRPGDAYAAGRAGRRELTSVPRCPRRQQGDRHR